MSDRLRVALYLNDRKSQVARFVRCLQQWEFDFTTVWRQDLGRLQPGDADVLLLHGGWYGLDRVPGQEQYGEQTPADDPALADAVRGFAAAGGGVVGVCCGAFNVVWLGLVPADISRAAGVGMHQLEVQAPNHPVAAGVCEPAGRADREWKPLQVVRFNGPILFPKADAQMVFSYDWEGRLGAVVAADYGDGRAVAISPHPERTADDIGADMPDDPLLPVAGVLRDSLLWAAGRA
jgi:phosphoribosylformylglycinamidine (FGAM) synthase-like amidotransferase family enzyme